MSGFESTTGGRRRRAGGRRRRRRSWRRAQRRAALLKRGLATLGVVLIAGGLHAVAAEDREPPFPRRPYVALGAGVTQLEPESPSSALTVSEDIAAGVELGLGYDFTRWLSGELHVADLGAADIDFLGSEVGDVGYRVYGVTALAYLFGARDGFIPFATGRDGAFRREGLSLFGRFGVGGMSNDSELDYERDHAAHAVFGVGLEYGFGNGFALRAELQGFDTDARYAGLSVLKRFGDVASAPAVAEPVTESRPAPEPEPESAAALPAPVEELPTIRPIVPPYVYFAFDEAELTGEARDKLDTFVDVVDGSGLDIAVGGHTDWIGPERYNEGLSDRRADAVRGYLLERGIAPDRVSARGYGETRPISTNLTEEGRAQNRRAEIDLVD